MVTRKFPWQAAMKSDARFVRYLTLSYLPVLGRLPQASRKIISQMLVPDPRNRATMDEVCADLWVRSLETCSPAVPGRPQKHEHTAFSAALELKRAAVATNPQLRISSAARVSSPSAAKNEGWRNILRTV